MRDGDFEMKKIAYIYTVLDDGYITKYPGVNKKVYAQVKALNKAGLDASLEIVKYESRIKRVLPFQTSSVRWCSLKVWEKYDGLYLRYSTSDYQMIKWLKMIKRHNPDFKVIVEIPTYPYDGELASRNRVIISRDKKYRHCLKNGVDKLVVNGTDDFVFGIPTILTCNGVDLDDVRVRRPIDHSGDTLRICFVAAFAIWHGAERAIEGLKDYYDKGGSRNIILNMVGGGEDIYMNHLKKMVSDCNVSSHVVFKGFLDGEQLAEEYDSSQLAISSLGLHRLHEGSPSTLKSREYLARGIPFVYSSGIADFENHPVDFALQLESNDNPVDFFTVINFYDGLMKKYSVSDLTMRIRKYAEDYVSIDKTMKPVVDCYMQS